jgi:polar amino acid transport system substrate-binding protein
MRFSTIYYRARQRLLVPENSDVNGLSDLKGERVCATRSSTTIKNLVQTGVVAFPVELRSDCLVALQERDVAAVTSDDAILLGLCRQDPQTKIVGPPIKDVQHYGLAMDRRRRGFVRFVNAVLKRVDLDSLSKRWLGDLAARSDREIRRCKIRGT